MTPRVFLKKFNHDERLISGEFFSSEPLAIEKGDRVGVVLLNQGGPFKPSDVKPFLYNHLMDPAVIDIPVNGFFRHLLSRFIAKIRSKGAAKDYEEIGGGSPVNRLTEKQSEHLEKHLNERYGERSGVSFHTYVAMRYWHPMSEEAARRMKNDGINKVMLLPLYPHYSKTTTGASLMYWWMLEKENEIPKWPTTFAYEYAANPKYLKAINERIDEGLQRFPREIRDDVQLLFSAHGTTAREMKERHDPYCCLIHSTVEQVMKGRTDRRRFHVAFQSKAGYAEWLTPSTPSKLKEIGENGAGSVLVVPIAFVSDHLETAFELDIEMREEAEGFGVQHYEVTSGLNSHPLFIEALGEVTISQLRLPSGIKPVISGDGAPAEDDDYPLLPLNQLPRFDPESRRTRCHQCERVTEARRWTIPLDDNIKPGIEARPNF